MKKTMNTILMLMLACTISAMAQTSMSSDSSMKQDKKMGKQMTMTGCIAEKDGKYMMMNKSHPDGVQLMSSEDMKPHVGHEMQATGMMEKMSGMSGDSGDSMKSGDKMKDKDMGMMEMKVTGMKMMSEQCDMSMMH